MTNYSHESNPFASPLPKWFTIAAVLALIWNLIGVMAFVMQMQMTTEMIAKLPEAEQAFYTNIPLWATIAFAFAVFGGAFGALALLMKKAIAQLFFIISLVGVIVQMFHAFVISDSFEVFGSGGAIMPTMVVVIALILVRFSAKAKDNVWIR